MNNVDLTISDSKINSTPVQTSQWRGKKITILTCTLAGCAVGAAVFGPIGALVGAAAGATLGTLLFLSPQNSILTTLAKKLVSLLNDEKQVVPTVVIEHATRIVLASPDSSLSTADQFWMDEAYAYLSDPNYAFPPDLASKIFERFDRAEREWEKWVEEEASKLGGKSSYKEQFDLALCAIQRHPRLKHYSPEDQKDLASKLCTSQFFKDFVWGCPPSRSFDISGTQPSYPNRTAALQLLKTHLYSSSEETPFEDPKDFVKLVYLAIEAKALQNLTAEEKSIQLAYNMVL